MHGEWVTAPFPVLEDLLPLSLLQHCLRVQLHPEMPMVWQHGAAAGAMLRGCIVPPSPSQPSITTAASFACPQMHRHGYKGNFQIHGECCLPMGFPPELLWVCAAWMPDSKPSGKMSLLWPLPVTVVALMDFGELLLSWERGWYFRAVDCPCCLHTGPFQHLWYRHLPFAESWVFSDSAKIELGCRNAFSSFSCAHHEMSKCHTSQNEFLSSLSKLR